MNYFDVIQSNQTISCLATGREDVDMISIISAVVIDKFDIGNRNPIRSTPL